MPVHEMAGQVAVVEIRADAEITVARDREIITVTYTDPGEAFGRKKPSINLILTADQFWEMVSKVNTGFPAAAHGDQHPFL